MHDQALTGEPANENGAAPQPLFSMPPADVKRRVAVSRKKLRRLYLRECFRHTDVCMAVDARTAGSLFVLSERAWRRLARRGAC